MDPSKSDEACETPSAVQSNEQMSSHLSEDHVLQV